MQGGTTAIPGIMVNSINGIQKYAIFHPSAEHSRIMIIFQFQELLVAVKQLSHNLYLSTVTVISSSMWVAVKEEMKWQKYSEIFLSLLLM